MKLNGIIDKAASRRKHHAVHVDPTFEVRVVERKSDNKPE
jgi:hypothetical protein